MDAPPTLSGVQDLSLVSETLAPVCEHLLIPECVDHISLLTVDSSDYIHTEYESHKYVDKISPSSEKKHRRLAGLKQGKQLWRNVAGERQLHLATHKGDYAAVKEILEYGVDASCADDKLRTPLHLAASKGNHSIVQLLLQHNADPNKQDSIGNTPLHLVSLSAQQEQKAACTSQISVVTELLKAGTDITTIDDCGRTPLILARSRLKILYNDKTRNNHDLKAEVTKVADMLHAYLSLSRNTDDIAELDSLTTQLASVSTRQQMDEFSTLLDTFTNLTLEKRHRGMT